MCIFLQHTLSPLFSTTWLSVYGVVATSSSLCDFSYVDVSSIRLLESYWYNLVLSSAPRRTSSEFITSSLASCIDWSIPLNTLGVPFSAHRPCPGICGLYRRQRLRACRFLDISTIFVICCPARGERVSCQFCSCYSVAQDGTHEKFGFGQTAHNQHSCGNVPVANSRTSSTSYPENRTIKCAERYSTNSSTLPGSSSFVVHCAENGCKLDSPFSVPMKYTNPII